MMFRSSVFAFIAATMSFAAEGANITVSATVDSRIGSVALKAGYQSMEVSSAGATWNGWSIGTAYTPTFKGVATGYEGRWAVEKSGQATLSGGEENTITIPTTSYSGCLLRFYSQAKQYAVALDQQGGSGETTSVTATYGAAMPAATMPTRTGYTFGGYYTDPNGGGTQYYTASGESARNWDATSVTKLYAKWTAGAYAVTLDRQSGAGGSSGVTATYGSEMPTITVPARTGYTFGGYYTGTNGGGTQYYTAAGASAKSWDGTRDTTLYAKWTALTYTVKLDRQSGTGGDRSVTAAYGSAMPTLTTLPARTGYRFGGYYTSQNGGGTQYYKADGTSARNWDKTSATTLYAKWTAATYTVKLDRQSGSGGPDTVTAASNEAMPTLVSTPTRQGYTFGGYYTEVNGDGVQYYKADGTSARNWNKTDDATLYAKWTASTYTITLDMLDGSGGSSSVCVKYGLPMLTPIVLPTCTGYTFGGYYTIQGGGGKQYYTASGGSARNWEETSVTKLYAKWTANTYTVMLDRQPGSGGSSSVTATYGSAMPSMENPTRAGYTFGGYYTEVNGDGTQYYNADGTSANNWDNTSDTTLYAKWTVAAYTVTLDRQEGSGGSSSVTAAYDSAMPSIEKPMRAGYTFGGYYTGENGGGTQYYKADGTSARNWNKTSDTTLYAKWTAKAYTVTFDRQSGSGGSSLETAPYGSAMPSITVPTRAGYEFDGYFTEVNGGGTQYYKSDGTSTNNWDKTSDTTIYAKWTVKTYTVKLDRQEGSGGSDSVTATYDDAMPSITVPTRPGYTFDGYYTEKNGGGKQYYNADGTSARNWNKASDTTLYAKWMADTYKVTFDPQPGSGGSSSVTAKYGLAMFTPIALPTRPGYTFGGYYTEENGGGTQYYKADGTSEKNWDQTGDTTLYAKWTANTYKVTFDPQPGSGGSSSKPVTYDAAMPSITVPTRSGYTFGGYYTEVNGDGTQYYKADGTSAKNWDKTGDTTLYAKWTCATYTVTFDPQPGSGGSISVTAAYDSAMPSIEKPTRAGYAFGGYYTSANGGGTQYYNADGTSARKWNKTSDTTLYAKWVAKTYTVTLDRQSGSGGSSSATAPYGSAMPSITVPTRTGYTFGGYYTEADDDGTQYYNAAGTSALPWDKTSDTPLYAKWVAKTYKVTLERQSGSGGTNAVTATYGSAMPAAAMPERPGYTFGGYYTEENGGGTQYYKADGTSARNWNKASNTTLYAKWMANTYTLTLEQQGGSGGSSSVTAKYGKEMFTPIVLPTRTGYTFGGYYSDLNDDGTRYYTETGASARNWDKTSDTTLYAKWTTKTYTVTCEQQSGSGGSSSKTVTYDSAMPSITVPTRTGYKFDGYYTGKDGDGTQYYKADGTSAKNWDKTINTTLYAKWTPNQYEVAFNPNGADGGEMGSQVFTCDVAQDLNLVEFTRTGHEFVGWATNSTGKSVYGDGATVSNLTTDADEIVTLYANWTGVVYTVTFDANGGTDAMEPMSCTYDVPTNLPVCAFTRDGYGFKGWTTNVAGGVLFEKCALVTNLTATAGAEVTLYACWKANEYEVNFNACTSGEGRVNDGENLVSNLTRKVVVGEAWDFPVTTNLTSYLNFVCWKYDAGGRMKKLPATVPPKSAGVTNIVAVWADDLAAAVNAPELGFTTFGTVGVSGTTNDSPHEANWFVQSSFTCDNETAVQSGALQVPESPTSDFYATWLTTTVTGAGVLSFQWKCVARERYRVIDEYDPSNNNDSGDALRFGLCNADGSFTEIARMEATRDWEGFVYPYTNDTAVTFAWTFQFNRGDIGLSGEGQGGGTGWVDRVTWTPDNPNQEYLVSFDASGGDGWMYDQVFTNGVEQALCSNEFFRTGHEFVGWATNSTGEVVYTNRQSVTLAAHATLYAVWNTNQYTVTFMDCGEVFHSITQDFGTVVTPPVAPSRTGYTFAGWTPAAPAKVPAKDVTCTAQWTPNKYMVAFDKNGGDGTMVDQTFKYDHASHLSPNGFTRTGYLFVGWATAADGDVVYLNGATVSNLTDVAGGTVTLYAKWKEIGGGEPDPEPVEPEKVWTVTFDANNGSDEMSMQAFTNGVEQALASNVFVRTGHAFAGWATNSTGEAVYADGEIVTLAAHAMLYATWTTNTYTVTLNANGGEGESSVVVEYGTEIGTIATPTRTGHTFAGWSTAADGGYPVDGETSVTGDMELFAQWTANFYTLTFDSNGGSEVVSITQECGKPVTAPDAPTCPGYTFAGWTPEVPATVPASNVTCTAQWTPNTYTVAFDKNGGDGTMADQTFTYDLISCLSSTGFTRTGYSFDGWAIALEGDVAYADGAAVSNLTHVAGGTVTLYAKWTPAGGGEPDPDPAEPDVWTVTFDANNGKDEMSIQSFTNDVEQALSSNVFVRTGHVFAGWATNSTGEAVYADGQIVKLTACAMLYAAWTPNKYKVTLNANDGEEASVVEVEYGTEVGTIATPTRTGYTFAGWFTAAEGGDPVDGETSVTGDMELFAQWTENFYTLTFDSNGGSEVVSITQECGKPVTAPDDPTRPGYKFDGWTPALPETMPAENKPFKAQWTPNTYKVKFDVNGGDGTMADQTFTYGLISCLSSNGFTRTGYSFDGWATALDGDVAYEDGDEVSNLTAEANGTVTLYAKWTPEGGGEPGPDPAKPEVWTVTFDANDGTDAMSMQAFTNGVEQALSSNTFVRVGHAFAGWATNSTGEVVYKDGESVTLATHAMLYAVWTPDTFTVTLHANGGEGEDSVVVEYGTMVEDIAVPTRKGYTFAGWFTAAEDGDPVHGDVLVTGEMELFAQWTESDEEDTDTPEPENTDPSEPGNTDTPEPGNTDPSEPGNTDTPEPGNTDTPEPGNADPAEPGNTDTPEQGNTDTPEPENAQGRTYLWTPVLPDGDNGGDAAFTGEIAESYDGYLQDAAGNVMGTITLKAAKAKGATSKLTVKLQLLAEKKTTVRGRLDIGTGRFEATDSSGRALSLLVGANSLSGSYGSYFIDGGQNKFTTKSAASKAIGTAVLEKWKGVTTVAWRLAGDGSPYQLRLAGDGSPYHTLSVSVANKGRAKVTGTLADGTKVSAKGQLIVGESWSCIPVTYAKKNARFAFNVWLPNGADATGRVPPVVTGIEGVIVGAPGSLKGGAEFRIDAAALGSMLGKTLLPYLPDGVPVAGGAKWTLPKAGKVVYVKGTATVNEAKAGANPSGLKLTYKAKAGTFKGSFKAYADVGGKPKATTVKVSGVVVDGIGYGAATVRKVGGVPVKIE